MFGISLNPRKKGNEYMHLVMFCGESGEIISVKSIEIANYVFVLGEKSIEISLNYMFEFSFIGDRLIECIKSILRDKDYQPLIINWEESE